MSVRTSARIRTAWKKNPKSLVGKIVCGLYPAANYHGVRLRLEPRLLLVESVRLLREEPIESDTVEMDPLLKRGRVLLTGTDLNKLAERSFYIESFVGLSVLKEFVPAPLSDDAAKAFFFVRDKSGPRVVTVDNDFNKGFVGGYQVRNPGSTVYAISHEEATRFHLAAGAARPADEEKKPAKPKRRRKAVAV